MHIALALLAFVLIATCLWWLARNDPPPPSPDWSDDEFPYDD